MIIKKAGRHNMPNDTIIQYYCIYEKLSLEDIEQLNQEGKFDYPSDWWYLTCHGNITWIGKRFYSKTVSEKLDDTQFQEASKEHNEKIDATEQEAFWASIKRSADMIRKAPAWVKVGVSIYEDGFTTLGSSFDIRLQETAKQLAEKMKSPEGIESLEKAKTATKERSEKIDKAMKHVMNVHKNLLKKLAE